jgi:hypothetical protein
VIHADVVIASIAQPPDRIQHDIELATAGRPNRSTLRLEPVRQVRVVIERDAFR